MKKNDKKILRLPFIRTPVINAHFKQNCLACRGNPLVCKRAKEVYCRNCNVIFCPSFLDKLQCPICQKGCVICPKKIRRTFKNE